MAAAPPVLPAPACGGSVERQPEGPAGCGSSLFATAMRLWMVALHSSSFSAAGGKLRSSCARAPKLPLAWAAVTPAWIAACFDF